MQVRKNHNNFVMCVDVGTLTLSTLYITPLMDHYNVTNM